MIRTPNKISRTFAGVVVMSGVFVSGSARPLCAQTSPGSGAQSAATTTQAPAQAAKKPAAAPVRWVPTQNPWKEQVYYQTVWGIDSLKVKYTESGEMVRFTYRVVDPARAEQLNDKKAEPALYDPEKGVKLVVPQMEKIGKLRQSSTPIAGMQYWMAFSNSGRRVRPGDHVSVEIGNFRAINLLVE